MTGGKYSDEGFGVNGGADEAIHWIGWTAVAQKPSVKAAVVQAFKNFGGEGLMKMEAHTGIGGAVLAEDVRQCCKHSGADEADMEGADFSAADAAGLFDVALDVAEGALGALEEVLACGGESDRTRCAVE